MKVSRVHIYLKLKNFILSFFSDSADAKEYVKKNLKEKTKKKYIEFFGMCRTSFLVVLEYLREKNPKKNEIIVCSYNLQEMIDVIKNYSFKAKFIDINNDNGSINIQSIKEKISNQTAAILYTNMFNDYSSIEEVKKLCEEYKILLIEDCAIYFGNHTIRDKMRAFAGSVGDVSIFSFGIMKNVCAIFGGSLATSNSDIYNFALKKNKQFKSFPKFLFFKKIILFIILKISLSKYIYNYIFFYIIKLATIKKIKPLLNLLYPALKFKQKTKLPESYYCKISNLSLKIISNYLKSDAFQIENNIRKKNNKIYHQFFQHYKKVKIIEINDFDYQNFLDYPIIVEKKNELVNFLLRRGLETRFHFYSNCEDSHNLIDCKNSDYFEKNLICLPSHFKITPKKIEQYCNTIAEFYGPNY